MLKNPKMLSLYFSIDIDPWPSRQSEILCTGRTSENKWKQSCGWTEICGCYKMIYADAHVRYEQFNLEVSIRLQWSVETVDREPWTPGVSWRPKGDSLSPSRRKRRCKALKKKKLLAAKKTLWNNIAVSLPLSVFDCLFLSHTETLTPFDE